jgi:hypothetical protein
MAEVEPQNEGRKLNSDLKLWGEVCCLFSKF